MRKSKVLIVGPNLSMGGVERASANYSNLLHDQGFDVTYLALIPNTRFFELNESIRYLEPPNYNRYKIDLRKTLLHIRQLVKEEQPFAILAFTKFYAALANMALVFSPYRVIVMERSSPLYQWPKQVEWFAKLSFQLKKCGGVISQTSFAASYHKKYYRSNRILVLPNPVKPMALPQIDQREKWILLVGRLNDDCKGFDRFMHMMNRIQFPDNEWKVVFAGGTREEADYLLALIDQQQQKDRIDFLGKVEDMASLYARASIFVIPSRSEGFPNALCEAMSAGLACVSLDFVAGPSDLIQDGVNGYLIPEDDLEKLARKVEEVMADASIRKMVGDEAKKLKDKLSYEQTAASLMQFLLNE